MEQCAGCHWHCIGIKKCKSMRFAAKEIDCNMLEAGLYSMPGNFENSIRCKHLKSETNQSATA